MAEVDQGRPALARGAAACPPQGGRDAIALAIAAAAILMFVGIGGLALPQALQSLNGGRGQPNPVLVSALLLNIALILFGWRHHRQLSSKVDSSRKSEAQARQLAETDPLTGFLNRRSLTESAERLFAECQTRGEAVGVLVADLDGFKQINDSLGHSAGDAIIEECARRIAGLLPERALAARLGGDEFACLVPYDASHPQRIDKLAADMIEAIALKIHAEGHAVEATVSIGLATTETKPAGDEAKPQSARLLHAADIAMYHAKRRGRNCSFWYEPSMESELRYRRELEAGIRKGIPAGEFIPYYEQQIDLASGKLTGFEMLARWNSPAFGLVNPQVFIPIAEEIGLIDRLSEHLIAQALNDAKAWDPKLTLSVNISPIQLRDPWFSQKLLKMLVEANFPPQRLEIEITESCLHENIGAVRTLLASLRNQGIKISLDDFGTGYSSLSQLRELPFDCIKIDRSFVSNLADSKDSATIVRAITSLGEGLGLPIVAEGIESAEVLEELRAYGDFKGQGYLYGRPESASMTRERLAGMNLLQAEEGDAGGASEPAVEAKPKRSATGR